jgi:hypothetical protein
LRALFIAKASISTPSKRRLNCLWGPYTDPAIYSRKDAVVSWEACIASDASNVEHMKLEQQRIRLFSRSLQDYRQATGD